MSSEVRPISVARPIAEHRNFVLTSLPLFRTVAECRVYRVVHAQWGNVSEYFPSEMRRFGRQQLEEDQAMYDIGEKPGKELTAARIATGASRWMMTMIVCRPVESVARVKIRHTRNVKYEEG
jgi:hypothetical protein